MIQKMAQICCHFDSLYYIKPYYDIKPNARYTNGWMDSYLTLMRNENDARWRNMEEKIDFDNYRTFSRYPY